MLAPFSIVFFTGKKRLQSNVENRTNDKILVSRQEHGGMAYFGRLRCLAVLNGKLGIWKVGYNLI